MSNRANLSNNGREIPPSMRMRRVMLAAIKRSKVAYNIARRLRFAWGSLLGPRSINGIPGRVHRNDTMWSYGSPIAALRYNQVGTAVVQILDESLEACNVRFGDVGKALEVGCNYGRIIRQLVTKIAPSSVYCCDILGEGPKFCARNSK